MVSSLNVKRKKIRSPKKSLPIVKCKCGFEFLILFDVQTMGQAIRKHALEHKKKDGLTQEETDHIENALIAQVFSWVAELE